MFCCRAASSPRPINSERYSAVALSTTSNANLQNNLDQTRQPRQSRTPRSVCAKTVCPTCFPPSWRTPGSVARLGARCCTHARTPRYRAPRRGSAQTWCHDQHQGEERHHNSKHVGEGGREGGGGGNNPRRSLTAAPGGRGGGSGAVRLRAPRPLSKGGARDRGIICPRAPTARRSVGAGLRGGHESKAHLSAMACNRSGRNVPSVSMYSALPSPPPRSTGNCAAQQVLSSAGIFCGSESRFADAATQRRSDRTDRLPAEARRVAPGTRRRACGKAASCPFGTRRTSL